MQRHVGEDLQRVHPGTMSVIVHRPEDGTYRLSPSPFTGHEVLILALARIVVRAFWHVVEIVFEVRIAQLIMEDFARVTEEHLILADHP